MSSSEKNSLETPIAPDTENLTSLSSLPDKGSVNISDTVIISIVKKAVLEIPEVVRLSSGGNFSDMIAYMIGRGSSKPDSVKIKHNEDSSLEVSAKVIVTSSKNISEIGLLVQMSISQALKNMLMIDAARIDIFIDNIEEKSDDTFNEQIQNTI